MEQNRCGNLDASSCNIEPFIQKLTTSRVLGDALRDFVESWVQSSKSFEELVAQDYSTESSAAAPPAEIFSDAKRLERIQSRLLDENLLLAAGSTTTAETIAGKTSKTLLEDVDGGRSSREAAAQEVRDILAGSDVSELRDTDLEGELVQHDLLLLPRLEDQSEAKTNPTGETKQGTDHASSFAELSPFSSRKKQLTSPYQCPRFLNMHLDLIAQGSNGHWILQTLRDYESVDDRFQLQHRFRHWMNGFLEAREKLLQIWKMRKDITGMLAPHRQYKSMDDFRDFSQIDWNWLRLPNSWSLDRGLKRWNVVCALVEQAVWEKFRVWRGTEYTDAKSRTSKGRFSQKNVIHVAEIGVFVGETSLYLLSRCFRHLYRESNILVQYHLIDPWEVDAFGGFLDFYRATKGYTEQTGHDVYRNLVQKLGNATSLYETSDNEDVAGTTPEGTSTSKVAEDEISTVAGEEQRTNSALCLKKRINHERSPVPLFEVKYRDLHGKEMCAGEKIPENRPGVFFHRVFSHQASKRLSVLDVLYVDGEHSFHGVHTDLKHFVPLTRYVVAGHDFDYYKFPGVTMAVLNAKVPTTDAFRQYGFRFQQELYLDSDTTWWSRLNRMK
ncbi:unnamed protein product [Amoebophrya sp. A120]|nr:unnamed protein product [Amoebophrya sp. A120]|eukprot:GSA120T00011521001.1